jgi:hypothetical protein
MRAQYITELLFAGAALLLVYGVGSTARADDAQPADPFAAVQTIEQGDLDGLRGGDVDVVDSFNNNVITKATNNSENSIGTMTIDASGGNGGTSGGAGGSIYGGSVSFNDNALQNFGGVYTSAINTAPGGIATALTSMTITLIP